MKAVLAMVLEYLAFLQATYFVILAVAVVVDYLTGVGKSLLPNQEESFSMSKAVKGFGKVFIALAGFALIGVFAFTVAPFVIEGISFVLVYKIIMTAGILYYGNSLIVNGLKMTQLPHLAIQDKIDNFVKSYFEKDHEIGGE